jgi:hypothetical protein
MARLARVNTEYLDRMMIRAGVTPDQLAKDAGSLPIRQMRATALTILSYVDGNKGRPAGAALDARDRAQRDTVMSRHE